MALHRGPLRIARALRGVRRDLARVDSECAAQVTLAEDVGSSSILEYIQRSNGKRLRATLHLLAARLCEYQGDSAIKLGAVLEMVHTATLVHDDVIDVADLRRGQASVNARWGTPLAVLAGDWLFLQAFRLCLTEKDSRILEIAADVARDMVYGELLECHRSGSSDLTEEEALDVCRRKTGSLFRACLQLGAVLGRRTPNEEGLLSQCGTNIGIAFQLTDDLLDITGDTTRLGKPALNDLKHCVVTLPIIYMLGLTDQAARRKVNTVIQERGFGSVHAHEISGLVIESGAARRVHDLAREYLAGAKECLAPFRDSAYKRALHDVFDYMVTRDH